MSPMRLAPPLLALTALQGCGSADADQGLTSAEERQLDDAAAALDEAQAEYEQAVQLPDPETTDETAEQEEH